MTDTRMYLGRPGSLVALRSPKGLVEAPRQRRVSVFGLGVGGYNVDQMVGGARTYTINYEQLTRDDFMIMQAFLDGHEGPGPFAFLDPGQRNMLPANVSGATSVTNDASGFAVTETPPADTFNRSVVSNAWGTSTSGHAWAITSTSTHYSTTGTAGQISTVTISNLYYATVDTGGSDQTVIAEFTLPVVPTGGAITLRVPGRWTDTSNYYEAALTVAIGGSTALNITKRVGGSGLPLTTGGASVTVGTHSAGNVWRVVFSLSGTTLRAYAYNVTTGTVPATWQSTGTDASLTTGNLAGAGVRRETSNSNGTVNVLVDNFSATPTAMTLGSSATYSDAGPRSLTWTFTNSDPIAGSALTISWPSSTFNHGIPVVSGRALCFSCYVRGGGTDAIVTYTPRLYWRDTAGVLTGSVTSGTPVASSSGAWAQLVATATPPAGAAYADMDVHYTSGASIGSIGYFRRFMLNEGSTPDTLWAPGTGVWPVRFMSMPEQWPFLSPELRNAPAVVLQEDVS